MQRIRTIAFLLLLPSIPVAMIIAFVIGVYLFALRPGAPLASADKDRILKEQDERERRGVDLA